jgi:hypothetical protein
MQSKNLRGQTSTHWLASPCSNLAHRGARIALLRSRCWKIEDGPGRPLGRSYRIKLWPSVLVLRDGEELARVVRPIARDEIERVLALL